MVNVNIISRLKVKMMPIEAVKAPTTNKTAKSSTKWTATGIFENMT